MERIRDTVDTLPSPSKPQRVERQLISTLGFPVESRAEPDHDVWFWPPRKRPLWRSMSGPYGSPPSPFHLVWQWPATYGRPTCMARLSTIALGNQPHPSVPVRHISQSRILVGASRTDGPSRIAFLWRRGLKCSHRRW
ncbi:hypothetical protein BVI434_3520004 [Burkholderia vietnamiensis]|nr:hypothetical protein BVI434_3520004 [Burkholderia vietnamiensis]